MKRIFQIFFSSLMYVVWYAGIVLLLSLLFVSNSAKMGWIIVAMIILWFTITFTVLRYKIEKEMNELRNMKK